MNLCIDSRKVQEGDMFFCIDGSALDGHDFAEQAVDNGAKVIIYEHDMPMKELLMSAEYIMAGGNENVILCERGIRTFEPYTRNTLDISAVPALHELTHLPVVVDPSHATGKSSFVDSMASAAAACGADGIMIEVHNDPAHALSDGPQSLTPDQFDGVMEKIRRVRAAVGMEN